MIYPSEILRVHPTTVTGPRSIRAAGSLLVLMIAFGLLYGSAMGLFSGVRGQHVWQVIYSALKVPMLMAVTFVVALPSFFVLNTLMGVREDFGRVLRALLATQAGLTIILASFAPFTLLWYVSCANYQAAILFNAMMFGLASIAAQRLLRQYYRPLIRANPVHRPLMRIWLGIFAFVGIQMGYVLRPFIGDPAAATTFLRTDPWGNAYVVVVQLIFSIVRH